MSCTQKYDITLHCGLDYVSYLRRLYTINDVQNSSFLSPDDLKHFKLPCQCVISMVNWTLKWSIISWIIYMSKNLYDISVLSIIKRTFKRTYYHHLFYKPLGTIKMIFLKIHRDKIHHPTKNLYHPKFWCKTMLFTPK